MRKTVISSASNELRGLFMDRERIDQHLSSLKECLSRLESHQPLSAEILAEDSSLGEIITRQMDDAVSICRDLASHLIYASLRKVPQSDEEKFFLLGKAEILTEELAGKMQESTTSLDSFREKTGQVNQQDWTVHVSRIVKVFWEYAHQIEAAVG